MLHGKAVESTSGQRCKASIWRPAHGRGARAGRPRWAGPLRLERRRRRPSGPIPAAGAGQGEDVTKLPRVAEIRPLGSNFNEILLARVIEKCIRNGTNGCKCQVDGYLSE